MKVKVTLKRKKRKAFVAPTLSSTQASSNYFSSQSTTTQQSQYYSSNEKPFQTQSQGVNLEDFVPKITTPEVQSILKNKSKLNDTYAAQFNEKEYKEECLSPELLTTDGFDDDLSAEQLFEVTESYNEENFSGEMKLEDGHGVDKFKFSDSPPPQVVPNVPSFTKNKNNEKQKKREFDFTQFMVYTLKEIKVLRERR